MFETHVYAVVRVKVRGTDFSHDPQEVANKVADAVSATPSAWMQPIHGGVQVECHGRYEISQVEFAESISGVLVNEFDAATGNLKAEYDFDEAGIPHSERNDVKKTLAEVIQALGGHPEAAVGNSKVHFALMRLLGLQTVALT